MPTETLSMDEIQGLRKSSITASIHPITHEELKALGESLFPSVEQPWRQTYFEFLAQNPSATFYHASTHDRVHVLYCRDREVGIWFLPGSAMGPLQPRGLQTLREIVDHLP